MQGCCLCCQLGLLHSCFSALCRGGVCRQGPGTTDCQRRLPPGVVRCKLRLNGGAIDSALRLSGAAVLRVDSELWGVRRAVLRARCSAWNVVEQQQGQTQEQPTHRQCVIADAYILQADTITGRNKWDRELESCLFRVPAPSEG